MRHGLANLSLRQPFVCRISIFGEAREGSVESREVGVSRKYIYLHMYSVRMICHVIQGLQLHSQMKRLP
jgi:hypothetical protein